MSHIGRLAVNEHGRLGWILFKNPGEYTGECVADGSYWRSTVPRILDPVDERYILKSAALRVAVKMLHDASWWAALDIAPEHAHKLWKRVRAEAGMTEPEL